MLSLLSDTHDLSLLHELTIEVYPCEFDSAILLSNSIKASTPNLRHLRLRGCIIPWKSSLFSDLVTLDLNALISQDSNGPTLSEMAQILQSCPNLSKLRMEELDLAECNDSEQETHVSTSTSTSAPPLNLPHLDNIIITNVRMSVFQKLFENIHVADDAEWSISNHCLRPSFRLTDSVIDIIRAIDGNNRHPTSLQISLQNENRSFTLRSYDTAGVGGRSESGSPIYTRWLTSIHVDFESKFTNDSSANIEGDNISSPELFQWNHITEVLFTIIPHTPYADITELDLFVFNDLICQSFKWRTLFYTMASIQTLRITYATMMKASDITILNEETCLFDALIPRHGFFCGSDSTCSSLSRLEIVHTRIESGVTELPMNLLHCFQLRNERGPRLKCLKMSGVLRYIAKPAMLELSSLIEEISIDHVALTHMTDTPLPSLHIDTIKNSRPSSADNLGKRIIHNIESMKRTMWEYVKKRSKLVDYFFTS